MRQVGGFLRISSTNKTDSHDITEILLTVALNTITITLQSDDTYKTMEQNIWISDDDI